jgi:hypothetical protein
LGSTPILDRPTIGTFYQTHEDNGFENAGERESPPDHYPLETRAGTVPVAELGMRGLYSQARYRALTYAYVSDYRPAEFAADYQPASYESDDESVRIGDPAPAARLPESPEARPEAPLQLAAGPASIAPEGQAKLIDVQATLALR